MINHKSNIVLIGMPGSGKSTVGILLAKKIGKDFIDTDILIQVEQERTLQDIVDKDGYMELRRIEENTLVKLAYKNHVVSTGGSAAYSHNAMTHLKNDGVIIFLNVTLNELFNRVKDFETRGLAKRHDQTLDDLFDERYSLYKKYADITIDSSQMTLEETCGRIISMIYI
jgi:shikimate kinase